MNIKILGTGCERCTKLFQFTDEVAKELKIDYRIERVMDQRAIFSYGVLGTPALVINEKVKVFGRVPGKGEIKKRLLEEVNT